MYLRGGSCDGADHRGHDVGVLPESDPAERGDLPAPTLECVLIKNPGHSRGFVRDPVTGGSFPRRCPLKESTKLLYNPLTV
jgi:hypothetical protein